MNPVKHWYVLYTTPRREKKVHGLLLGKGFESYCPMQTQKRQWSDRVKMAEEPLFKSYVFVQLDEQGKTDVRFVSGVVNFIYWLGKPAIVRTSDIDRIKRFLNEYKAVEVSATKFEMGSKVIITSGVLMDKEATVISDHKKRVEVEIESLGCKLVAFVEKGKVSPLSPKGGT